MKVLVLGATGATGRLVVQQLVKRNIGVKVVVRRITDELQKLVTDGRIECVIGSVSEYEISDFMNMLADCDAVISCLGHNITLKGIFGKPRLLVTNSIRRSCEAFKQIKWDKVKVVLMNTTANRNKEINEYYSLKDRIILAIIRFVLPPQKDNEEAAKYLADNYKKNNSRIEWAAVRPDTLINEDDVTGYDIVESPKRSPVFDAGKTSRINTAHFMTELVVNDEVWNKWKYRMPVVYNKEN